MLANRTNAKLKRRKGEPKYSPSHPHPKHIREPERYTCTGLPRCQGKCKDGGQCKRASIEGSKFCSVHTDLNRGLLPHNSKFEENAPKIVMLLRQGYTMSTAAARCHIHPRVITDWRRRGRDEMAKGLDDGVYAKFYFETEEARLYACSLVENALFSAAVQGNVTAMLRYLECRLPDIWNAKRTYEISVETKHKLDINTNFNVKDMTDEELRRKVKEIAEAVDTSVGMNVDDARLEPIPVEATVTDA